MTIEETALLAAIAAEPAEDVHRLAYADWLDEGGRHERAEFIRVQCERAVLERPVRLFSWHDPECRRNAGRHRRLFELRGDCQRCAELRAYHSGLEQLKTRIKALRECERALYQTAAVWLLPTIPAAITQVVLDWGEINVSCTGLAGVMHRGFVDGVTCTFGDWLAHWRAVLAAQPITRVKLKTHPEIAPVFQDDRVVGVSVEGGQHLHPYGWPPVAMLEKEWPGLSYELPPSF